jgi:RNA polymerase sigma factor (sigma-70 family)
MAKTTVSPLESMIRRLAEDHQTKNLSDRELLGRFCADKDEAAFGSLVRRHGPMVLSVCRNVAGTEQDAEDVFQATFLVLARKAGSIRKMTSAANWLHGVAYRIALSGRKAFARRQRHETRAGLLRSGKANDDLSWQEVQCLIHAELTSLAECYRAPLVLCFLEGWTQDEAAKQLSISKTTLKKRLERGRSLLRMRLLARGLGPAAVLAASSWPGATAQGCLPPMLASATTKAGLAFSQGQAICGLVTGSVCRLVEGTLRVTVAAKTKVAVTALLMLALVPAIGGWVAGGTGPHTEVRIGHNIRHLAAPADSGRSRSRFASADDRAAVKEPAPTGPQQTLTVSGRVLDPSAQPAARARLLLFNLDNQIVELGSSAADGGFKFQVAAPDATRSPFRAPIQYLVAQRAGAGVDFARVPDGRTDDPVELRLVHDLPIKGRVINTEGKPVAGAQVFVVGIGVYADSSVDSFLSQWKNQELKRPQSATISWMPESVKYLHVDSRSFLSATTDSEGRFAIAGAGRERSVTLEIRGPGIAACRALVVSRAGLDLKPYNVAAAEFVAKVKPIYGTPQRVLYGPDLSIVVEADRPVRGLVKDIDTGKPLAGVVVALAPSALQPSLTALTGQTGASGRFEIRGAPRAEAYTLDVPSDPAAGYLPAHVRVADKPGYEPIAADVLVKKGVIVTGRVLDAVTKTALPGWAEVDVLEDNPFVRGYPDFLSGASQRKHTEADGTFRLVTIPGPVLVRGGPSYLRLPEGEPAFYKYKPVVGDSQHPRYFYELVPGLIACRTAGGRITGLDGNFCKVLTIEPGVKTITQDVIVEPAAAFQVKIQDSEGRPLSGTLVSGVGHEDFRMGRPLQLRSDTCFAYALEPGKPRQMVFYAPDKMLIGALLLQGNHKEPAVAKLGPAGGVKGRLVEDGKPLHGIVVRLQFGDRAADRVQSHVYRVKPIETDGDGAFQMDTVIPELKFMPQFTRAGRTFEPLKKLQERSVAAGAMLNLGDIEVKAKTNRPDD